MVLLWLILGILVLLFGWTAFVGAPYVPSRRENVHQALTKLYRLKRSDLLIDLGSGEGLVLRQAAKLGARAVGYEINPVLFFVSKLLTKVNPKIKVIFSNYWNKSLPDGTTVVYIFGVGRDMKKLKEWLQDEAKRLNKHIYLISLGFEIDNVKPVKTVEPYYLYRF